MRSTTATALPASTTSMLCPISSRIRWTCSAGTRTTGSSTFSWMRSVKRNEVRLLDARLRGLAEERRGRADGGELGLCPPADGEERGDGLGSEPDRGAQSQRHQGRGGAGARRLVDRRGACRGDRAARADGRGAAQFPPAGPVRQGGREYRQYQRRAAVLERRLLLVGRRGGAIWPPVRPARRSLRPHPRMARCGRRAVEREA